MTPPADPKAIANEARRCFLQALLRDMPAALSGVDEGLQRAGAARSTPSGVRAGLRECGHSVQRRYAIWETMLGAALAQLHERIRPPAEAGQGEPATRIGEFSLVDDQTIELDILASRLALAIMDLAASEFSDLRLRITHLERREELRSSDFLRPQVLARLLLDAWLDSGLDVEQWRIAQPVLHEEFAHLLLQAYHDTNCWLIERRVLPEIDLRPMIRRTEDPAVPAVADVPAAAPRGNGARRLQGGLPGAASLPHEGPSVLGRLGRLVGEQVPDFELKTRPMANPRLQSAMAEAGRQLTRQFDAAQADAWPPTTTLLLDGLNAQRKALKRATESPIERATIELVALLFQSILTEDRLPASVRIWFARLQMPVLRVAIAEPDFFAGVDHPARRLIDRMGACVMGFDAATAGAMGLTLESEIKRVVQVVEAYPDTGRQVFQTVLSEFESFLEHYFRHENAVSRVGVSLAQQVEQRETLAIQYTIELRRMLDEVPVQEGVRDFLFQVWADVLAITAVKSGAQSEPTKQMRRAAADLIWAASAKVTREERAEVLRRLPALRKTLREGMDAAGLPPERQERQLQGLNDALAAAFTAKTAPIPSERLEMLMLRLETLEELLPGGTDFEIDEAMVRDLSDHQRAELEVVGEGGSMPDPAMVAWARGIQVGHWFKLDYRGRNEPVQLAWQGMRRQLSLFASPSGRCVLFQQHRLASFLQAGLLVPAEDETLTARATREALAKLDADPSRLLN